MHALLPVTLPAALAALLMCGPGHAEAAQPAASSATGAASAPVSKDLHGLWRIDQARSEPIIDRRKARLDFGADGMLVGHTSCNTMRASYTLDGYKIAIGPVMTTKMTCGPLALEQEDRILTALELAATARVRDDGLLEIRDAEGRGLLRGTRFSNDPEE